MSVVSFDLKKQVEVLSFALEKAGIKINPCQVHLVFDVSYSFNDEHRDGYTQQLLNRFVPFSMLFDKNHTLDSYVFGHDCEKLDDINETNYTDYVKKHIQKSDCYNGGTNYLPIFKLLVSSTNLAEQVVTTSVEQPTGFFGKLFGKPKEVSNVSYKETDEKHLVFFITDGAAQDQKMAKEYLDNVLKTVSNPYFVFISISDDGRPFPFFADNYADTNYSCYFDIAKCDLKDLVNKSDDYLYEKIITPSLTEWMNK